MIRRFVSSAALIACATAYAFAAERATFILTDGERKSGTVVFHGDQHENLINGFLNLGVDNGKDMTFPVDQVAVIDFVGGQPPTAELAQLGTLNMLVTRDGATQQGRFVNMTGGDTLFWENMAGQRQQFAIRNVTRVYLNPPSARIAFGYTAPVAPAAQSPTQNAGTPRNGGNQRDQGNRGGQGNQGDRGDQRGFGDQGDRRGQGTRARGVTVRVDARRAWSDSGLTVNRGDRLIFETSTQERGLLGRIDNGAAFAIGNGQQAIVMRASGRLMLGVSGDERRSDRDSFTVIVSQP